MFRTTITTLTALAAMLCWPGRAAADNPPDQDIRYQVHTDPYDSQSPVYIRFDLHLSASTMDGNSVGWHVDSIHIESLDSSGKVAESWTQSDVSLSTGDGLWDITHADAAQPVIGEFLAPPLMTGTAANDNSSATNAIYSLQASANTPQAHPYPNTAFITHQVLRDQPDPPEPIDPGSDDPVDGAN